MLLGPLRPQKALNRLGLVIIGLMIGPESHRQAVRQL